MRLAAILAFAFVSLVALSPAPATTADGLVELQTPTGTAYLSVLIRHEPSRLLAYVLITRKLPALPVPFADVKFELLDAAGQIIPTAPVPNQSDLVELPDPRGTTANGLYLVTPGPNQFPTSARILWQGQTANFPELKTWDN